MKVFLCGGGAGDQTVKANKRLNEVIDHSKPCLYIPLAMEEEMYALPEEVTLFVNDDKMEVIGNRPFYLFEDGVMVEKRGNWV